MALSHPLKLDEPQTNTKGCLLCLTSGLTSSSHGKQHSVEPWSYWSCWSYWNSSELPFSPLSVNTEYVLRYKSTCTCSKWWICAAFPFPVWRRNQWHNVLDLQPFENHFSLSLDTGTSNVSTPTWCPDFRHDFLASARGRMDDSFVFISFHSISDYCSEHRGHAHTHTHTVSGEDHSLVCLHRDREANGNVHCFPTRYCPQLSSPPSSTGGRDTYFTGDLHVGWELKGCGRTALVLVVFASGRNKSAAKSGAPL